MGRRLPNDWDGLNPAGSGTHVPRGHINMAPGELVKGSSTVMVKSPG